MSDAKKCDRCGAFYKVNTKSRIVYEYYGSGVSKTKNCGDLCERCSSKFDKWWNKFKRNSDAK